MATAVLLACLALLVPVSAIAQDLPDSTRARPSIEGLLTVSDLGGETVVHLGAAATLRFGPLSVGLQGLGLTGDVELGSTPGLRTRLDMGYGGVLLRYGTPRSSGTDWEASLLLGAGAADHRDPVGTRLGKEVFPVVEPSVAATIRIAEYVSLTAGGGYRWIGGTRDLGGVTSSDIRSLTARIGLRIGG